MRTQGSSHAADLFSRLFLCGTFAAEIAFFFALSMVPFAALTAMAAVSWLPSGLGEPLAATVVQVFPSEAGLDAAAIERWVGSARGTGWLALGVGMAVWTTFRFMWSCLGALGFLASGRTQGWKRGLVTAISVIPLMVVWMLTVLAAAFGLLVAPGVHEALSHAPAGSATAMLRAALPHLSGVLMLVVALACTYRAAPGLSGRWGRLVFAATLTAATWLAVGFAFTRMIPFLWEGRDLYGALGSFLLFLLWCYANAWVLLLGGIIAGSGGASRAGRAGVEGTARIERP